MPNKISPTTGLVNLSFVSQSSRYLNSEIINYTIGTNNFLTFKTFKRPTRATTDSDKFYTITSGTAYRPDIVSKRVYGVSGYWSILLMANNMKDILDFSAGKQIIIPTPYQ